MIKQETKENIVDLARITALAPLGFMYAGSGFTSLMLSTGIGNNGYDVLSIAGGSLGLAAVAGACGLGIGIARNITLKDVSNAGPALRSLGQDILEKARQAGQALGILKEGQTATNKVVVEGVAPKEPWSKLAIESVGLMVAPAALMSTVMALGATAMTIGGNFEMLPIAVGAVGVAAASDYLLYKSMNNSYKRDVMEHKEEANAKRVAKELANESPSLG